jgi:hypothetical protein
MKPAKEPAKEKPKAAALPSKLIISASKKLLAEVGAGKISFEDFTKGVSAEFVNFNEKPAK